MASQKACYWMALSVLAFSLGNHLMARYSILAASVTNRSLSAAEQVSDRAVRLLAQTEAGFDRSSGRFARSQATLACAQAQFASLQAVLAAREVALARAEAARTRVVYIRPVPRGVICPRQRLKRVPAF
jgi:hypothetical protein